MTAQSTRLLNFTGMTQAKFLLPSFGLAVVGIQKANQQMEDLSLSLSFK